MLVVAAEAAAAAAAAARLSLLVAVAVAVPLYWQVVAAVAAQMMWMAAVVVAAALWRWMRPGQLGRREGQRLAGRQLRTNQRESRGQRIQASSSGGKNSQALRPLRWVADASVWHSKSERDCGCVLCVPVVRARVRACVLVWVVSGVGVRPARISLCGLGE